MRPFYAVGGGGGNPRCVSDTNAAGCNINSFPTEVLSIIIVAVIVGLVLFDLAWKFRRGTQGPFSRLLAAVVEIAARVARRTARPRSRRWR